MAHWAVMTMYWRVSVYLLLAAAWLTLAACGPATASAGIATAAGSTHTQAASPAEGTAAASSTPQPSLPPTGTATATPAPTLTPSATPCAETHGKYSSLKVPSSVLNYDIDTRLYLPPCYASTDKVYPVLYLVHGLNFTEDQWERLGVGHEAEALVAAGEIAPMIIVLPRDRKDIRFDPAFVVDLVPYIDAHYRTRAERAYRAIGGMSRGAGWAIHLGLRYPEIFGLVGAHSPAVFFGDENNILAYARADAKSGIAPTMYFDVGESDAQGQRSAYWLNQVASWFGFGYTYLVQPGSHSEKYWTAHLPDYLRFYAHDWLHEPYTPTPRPTAKMTQTIGPFATIVPTEPLLPTETAETVEATIPADTETPTP
jgi:enterochelin esterase-like enzyme